MTDISIDRVPIEDVPAWSRAMRTTFLETPDGEETLRWRAAHFDEGRLWGAKAGGRYVATFKTFTAPFSVPGYDGDTVDIDADGVTAVTVAATHRRRGLLRSMLTTSLAAAHDRGDPVSILIAAEWPIYGRFGYWPASQWTEYTVASRSVGARLLHAPSGGQVREADRAEMEQLTPKLFDQIRRQRAGNLCRDSSDWEWVYRPELRSTPEPDPVYIVHEDDAGVADGYLSWRATGGFDLDRGGKIRVNQVLAATPAGRAGLWDYLLNMDVVEEVTIGNAPPDEPVRLQLADGRALRAETSDAVWLRLLDVPAAMSTRGYAVPGTLVFEVIDDDIGGYGAGRYILEAGDSEASCTRASTGAPQLRMSQRALAGVYLGDSSLRLQHAAGLVEELQSGAIARADAMLRTGLLPWTMTGF